MLSKRLLSLVLTLSLGLSALLSGSAVAKAKVVAVFTLKSATAQNARAASASRSFVKELGKRDGWDAVLITAKDRSLADRAAAVGALVYFVGQYTEEPQPHIRGAFFDVATEQKIADVDASLAAGTAALSKIDIPEVGSTNSMSGSSAKSGTDVAEVPSGELISVMIQSDVGSRISQEGDAFAVLTTSDYYYKGKLLLPKGSPGYGVITHLKRAGSFHAGGELNITVKRLVTPSGSDLLVETNGATADADKQTEQNGNAFGQYLLWGVGMFAKRGNDILIKKGTVFHVSTQANKAVPVVADSVQPARLDETLVTVH